MTLKKKIEKYQKQFKTQDRNGETIVVFDNESEELQDAVFAAHGDRLPDDWIFDKFQSILSSLTDYDIKTMEEVEENRAEIVDGLVDVYTSDLTKWLHSSNHNVYYIDEALKEYGTTEDGFKLLAIAQYMAIDEIFSEVVKLLEE